ncbi:serine/threonine-protein kinase TBK1-like [Centruroides sculpturatus]|uniref:serine/threonine-protein kinase TBK1-like n=1 Tax=Centruroides sculpturatus TaxID=218467 RepID=UPI000C6DA6EF|nr:serine/threonine-protein kinase TBK1-like [Centruroides sculpturatus]
MSYLRGSANYVWSTTCVLGKGSTGAVYQGVNKAKGDSVAVKTFNHVSQMRPYEVQMREFEVLKKVCHQNIVKLLAIEEEVETQSKVLVMELCTGGSLFTILDDPQNSNGLEESEFLCVLRDLSAGMKYLRDNNIIHRDLKPGNIMKYISEDGKSVYKLTDFGAARELDDDQQFMSLYGTEEYLHPDMYERAVLRHPVGKSFRATVDLWSIGVTLYHLATGSLPFRPYGGRRNKETMHYITTKKASGVISGVQCTENGPIEWSEELPKSCLLSQGLKNLVTTLLAGILECNAEKMWSFDKFFDSVTDIVSRKVFHIFYMNASREITIYMQPEKIYNQLKEEIMIQTHVPVVNQLLLYEKALYDKLVEPNAKVSILPSTSIENPLILIQKDNTDIKLQTGMEGPSAKFPMFHMSTVNVEHDAVMAKTCCSIAHAVKRLIEKLVRSYRMLSNIPNILLYIINEDVNNLSKTMKQLTQRVEALEGQVKVFVTCQENIIEIIKHFDSNSLSLNSLSQLSKIGMEKQHSNNAINLHLASIRNKFKPLESMLQTKQLQKDWDTVLNNCPKLDGCNNKAETYVNKIRDSWQAFVRDKTSRTLSYHDEQFHLLEKVKIQQNSKKLLTLFRDECVEACHVLAKKLEKWYKEAQKMLIIKKSVEEELIMGTDMVDVHDMALKNMEDKFSKNVTDLLTEIKQNTSLGVSQKSIKLSSRIKREYEKFKEEEIGTKDIMEETSTTLANIESLLSQFFVNPLEKYDP